MSYDPAYQEQGYTEYTYYDPNNVAQAQTYYPQDQSAAAAYAQYQYPYNYQQVPYQQAQFYGQYQQYQYQDVQWVPRPEVPGHSYSKNRQRGRGGQNQSRRDAGNHGNYYTQSYVSSQQYYEPQHQQYEQSSVDEGKPKRGRESRVTNGHQNSGASSYSQRESGGRSKKEQETRLTKENKNPESYSSQRDTGSRYRDDRGAKSKQYGRREYSGRSHNSGREMTGSPATVQGVDKAGDHGRGDKNGDFLRKDQTSGGSRSRRGGRRGREEEDSQKGTIFGQLSRGRYECMVCYDNVKVEHAIWTCSNCYHAFHLHCIKKWARSSTITEKDGNVTGWRCPACQNVTEKVPNQYRCYCGKMRDPPFSQYETPHSCGEVCNRKKKGDCPHNCNILCHPGPCPPCTATVNKTCDCGKSKQFVRCGQDTSYRCESICDNLLNCGLHTCKVVCHTEECLPCTETLTQECHGGHKHREVVCGSPETSQPTYSCGEECHKALKCGNHTCEEICHPGDCGPCPLLPELITHCQCGQTPLAEIPECQRSSCADPIPSCDKICSKTLSCGPKAERHKCERKCHSGECGPCEGETTLLCVCGTKKKVFNCTDVIKFTDAKPYKCEKRCTKKKMCGRHKCTETCCTRDIHICEVTCGKKLKCGRHKCKALCHRGNCQPCLMSSFEELTCHCGVEVIFPPVPCGTRPPECHKPCARLHPCQHTVRHNCHSDNQCPPCTELTEKVCMGGHETRKNIPCHMSDISCGRPCGQMLKCGIHKCIRICHKGECEGDGVKCRQPCPKRREECQHLCGAPCHPDDPCPRVPCKTQVSIKCPCGHRSAAVPCGLGGETSNISEYQKMTVQQLSCGSMDIAKLTGAMKGGVRSLDCNEECAVLERNRRVALALEIKNPDLLGKLGSPSFTDFLKDYAKKYPKFALDVEKALSDLVQTAKQSKHPNRSHAFQPMTREQRQFVHELAEFYGCETQSYDAEPKKNVVATAKRDKCWLPSVSVTTLIQRELRPKAPPPIPHMSRINRTTTPLRSTANGASNTDSAQFGRQEKSNSPVIDYFDFSTN